MLGNIADKGLAFAAERVESSRDDGLRIETGRLVHFLGRILVDEKVRQSHRPEFQPAIEQPIGREKLHHKIGRAHV